MNDHFRHSDSNDEASLTDKTCFFTPYNQSIISKSNMSVEKIKPSPKENPKHKITHETLKSITRTSDMSQITELNLDGNSRNMKHRLKYISGLHNLMNLKELNLSNNDIEKIENLNSLKNLHVLNLSFNKISKLENISVLKNLEILNLSNNLIEEIPPIIVKNINLTEINLSNNLVSEKSSINNLRNLTKLTTLSLLNNPINDLQNYPVFIFHSLKKLQFLDGKMTPNYSKNQGPSGSYSQQVTITLGDIPARTPQSTLDDLVASEYQAIEPQSLKGSAALSYEQRLQATHNRLAELSQMNNQIRFYNNESNDKQINSSGNENILTDNEDSPLIDIPKFEPEAMYGFGPEKQSEEIEKGYGRSGSGLSENGVIGRYLKEKVDVNESKNMGSGFNLKLNQNNQKDSEATRATTSPQKKFIDFPGSSAMQEYYTGLSKTKDASKTDSNDSNRDLWSSLAKMTSDSEKGLQSKSDNHSRISAFNFSNQLEEYENKNKQERTNAYQVVMNALQPSFGRTDMDNMGTVENREGTQKETEVVQANMVSLSEKTGALRLEINQKFVEYDTLSSSVNTKREFVLEILVNIEQIMHEAALKINRVNARDQENMSLFKEKRELANKIKNFLEVIEDQTESHLNYFLIWNQVNLKLEDKEAKEFIINGQKFTIECVDSLFNTLSKHIDANTSKLDTIYSQIFTLKAYIHNNSYNNRFGSYTESGLDSTWQHLFANFDSLAHDTANIGKLFAGIRNLYVNLFKLIKTLIQLRRNEARLDISTKPLGKITPDDFPQTAPTYESTGSTQRNINTFSTLGNESYRSHSKMVQNAGMQEDMTRRALGEINKDNNKIDSNRGILKSGSKNKPEDNVKLVRSAKKPETSPKVKQKGRKSMYDGSAMMKENQTNDDVMIQLLSENEDPRSARESGGYSSPKAFSTARKIQTKQDLRSAESKKGLMSVTTPRNLTKRLESVENDKICQYCVAKDNIVKLTQEEMLKTHKEKASYEIEITRLQSELARVQQESQAQISQLKGELLRTSNIQHQEKENYTKAVVLLSELCNNNAAKLDEIRLRITSTVDKFSMSSLNPSNWLISMQSSTIEDLIKANADLEDKVNIFVNEFEQLLSNGLMSYLNPPTKAVEETNIGQDIHGRTLEDISHINKNSRDALTPFYSHNPTPFHQPSELQSIQEVDSYIPTSANNGYLGLGYLNKADRQSHSQLDGFNLDQNNTANQANITTEGKHIKDMDLLTEGSPFMDQYNSVELGSNRTPMMPNQRKVTPSGATNTAPESFTLDPQHHHSQLPMNIEIGETSNKHREDSQLEQVTLQKSLSEDSNGNFHQILFGNGGTAPSRKSHVHVHQNSMSGIALDTHEEDSNSGVQKESSSTMNMSYSPMNARMYGQTTRIDIRMMSNLQENIVQHLKQNNEKSDAYKHLKRISNNIHFYKGIKERLSDQTGRKSSRGNNNPFVNSKSKTLSQCTPAKLAKASSASMMTYRGSTMREKNQSIPDSTRELVSVRTPSSQGRIQIDYGKLIFRKQVEYPVTHERDVNIYAMMNDKKKVLESPEMIENYNERFDVTSPHHPVFLGMGNEGRKSGGSTMGSHAKGKGKELNRGKSTDKNLRW